MKWPNSHSVTGLVGAFFVMPFLWGFTDSQRNTLPQDSTMVQVRHFKEKINDRYTGRDFNYDINDTGGVNLLQELLQKFFTWLGNIFGIEVDFIDYQTMTYIVYGLLAAIALYLCIKFLIQAPVRSVFKTEEKAIDGFNFIEEDIKQINFDQLIAQALEDSNYRLATRYLYLKSLKTLANKQVISWHYDKTNTDYLNEISDENIRKLFKDISYIYDYVWYGKFAVSETDFNKNKSYFSTLNKQING
ncbi:hypothetical protein ACFSQP_01955 [Bizionia sediminis]|uniref:DUF4129 domain-containing protein n=1 Tax=Bizionia sediminis TaxID=1737064 RepID=A0ABW5KS46_9FLAO